MVNQKLGVAGFHGFDDGPKDVPAGIAGPVVEDTAEVVLLRSSSPFTSREWAYS